MRTSASVSTAPAQTERVALRRLLWVGPLAIVLAVAANIVIRAIALALFAISPAFPPLGFMGIAIVFTIVGVLGAVIVFALVGRFARRPIRLFWIVATVALLLSFVPDFLLAARMPGASVLAVGTLMVMHVVAAAISVGLLTTLALE